MEVKILKKRVDIPSRKLKAGWTMQTSSRFNIVFPENKIKVLENGRFQQHPYGVSLGDVNFVRLNEILVWIDQTVSEDDYFVFGDYQENVWFKNERDRTLLILKWS